MSPLGQRLEIRPKEKKSRDPLPLTVITQLVALLRPALNATPCDQIAAYHLDIHHVPLCKMTNSTPSKENNSLNLFSCEAFASKLDFLIVVENL